MRDANPACPPALKVPFVATPPPAPPITGTVVLAPTLPPDPAGHVTVEPPLTGVAVVDALPLPPFAPADPAPPVPTATVIV